VLVGILSLAAVAGIFVPERTIAAFYTDPIILEFAAGLVLASVWRRGRWMSRTTALCLAGLGFLGLHVGSGTDLPRIVWAGIPAMMIVAGVVHADAAKDQQPMRLPMLLGDASYSIYLSHVIVLPVLATAWTSAGLGVAGLQAPAFLALALAASALAGAALYGAVERPLMRHFAARRRRRTIEIDRAAACGTRLDRIAARAESPS
jgi:exopolysaccharide production protein ExoZ